MFKYLVIALSVLSLTQCGDSRDALDLTVYDSELDSLNAVLEKDEDNIDALQRRSDLYYADGELELALTDLNRKMAFKSSDRDFLLKGNILLSKADFESANASYRLCVEQNPKNAECYLGLGRIQMYLEKFNTSLSLLDSALMQNKGLAEAYFLKGLSFELRQMVGDSAKAMSSYQTAIDFNPNYYEAFMQLGNINSKLKDSLALAYYDSAIEIESNRLDAHYNKAMFLQENSSFDRAFNQYDRILEVDPNSFLAFYNQGYLLLVYAEKFDEAIEKFNLAIKHKPDYAEAYYNRALCYQALGKLELARADCRQALILMPQSDQAARLMSEID